MHPMLYALGIVALAALVVLGLDRWNQAQDARSELARLARQREASRG